MNTFTQIPTDQEIDLAKQTSRALSAYASDYDNVKLHLPNSSEATSHDFALPASALRLLLDILEQMAAGNAVTLVPIHAELTTLEAADLLNVSRPYLIKLLNEGEIAFHHVGTHRRILASDALNYKKSKFKKRKKAVDQLSALSQELNL